MYSTKVLGAIHKLAEETDIGGGSSVLITSPRYFFGQWFDPQNIVNRYRYYRITFEFQSSRIEKSIDTFNNEDVVHNVSFVTYNTTDQGNRIICLSFGFQGRYCVCKSARMKLNDDEWTDIDPNSIYMVKLIGSNYPI
ncbi:hypothetical protein B5F14_06665 [Faecalitalea cylindroides]|uniref:Uncharacterized protein n=1 Tax=Faecalitalea cylindroides TaxID=39483 RepID=A0A1Y4LTY6_9FIRM|nr:hypothetical protein [Faecalitalea cylindroides]OUP60094.1 hypothetical protein B5F14_06665 [Faecalitalea cylindroides]